MIFNFITLTPDIPNTARRKLAGTVTVDGTPTKRLVVVIDRYTFETLGAALSNVETGKWEITSIPERPEKSLLIFALDNTEAYNAEIADYISQVI